MMSVIRFCGLLNPVFNRLLGAKPSRAAAAIQISDIIDIVDRLPSSQLPGSGNAVSEVHHLLAVHGLALPVHAP
jgi:hypothetical protein